MITFDTHELSALASDLGKMSARSTGAMIGVFKAGGEELVQAWAANARSTSGVHGKHYPDSIDSEMQIGRDIVIEVGPNPAKPQGKMSFENGSKNQPPHLDGQRAADTVIPLIDRRIDAALAHPGL